MVGEGNIFYASGTRYSVSVSLPRLGGWRDPNTLPVGVELDRFQSRCRDWVVGEMETRNLPRVRQVGFSLVAEIGWLARPL